MTESSEPFDDELLSAYIDGELTEEQRASVEQRLADDPRARQLVEELRELRRDVQSMPKETIGEDLRATVVRRAERTMLLGADQPTTLPANDSSASRRWVWAVLAVAATLLLMFVTPDDQLQDKPVASVQPGPAGQPSGELRSRALEETPALVEEDAARGGVVSPAEPSLPVRTNDSASSRATRSRSVPAIQGGLSGEDTLATAAAKDEQDTIEPAFQVHITLNQGPNNVAKFNRMLFSNGIALEQEQAESEQNLVDSQAELPQAKTDLKDQMLQQLESNLQTFKEKVLLVEAPAENIESMLADCSSDVLTCATVRVETEEASNKLPIENLSQYERDGKQLAVNQQSYLKRTKQQFSQAQQGKARWLNTGQLRAQSASLNKDERNNLGKGKIVAKKSSQSPVQVLIILQQALSEPSSGGVEPPSPADR